MTGDLELLINSLPFLLLFVHFLGFLSLFFSLVASSWAFTLTMIWLHFPIPNYIEPHSHLFFGSPKVFFFFERGSPKVNNLSIFLCIHFLFQLFKGLFILLMLTSSHIFSLMKNVCQDIISQYYDFSYISCGFGTSLVSLRYLSLSCTVCPLLKRMKTIPLKQDEYKFSFNQNTGWHTLTMSIWVMEIYFITGNLFLVQLISKQLVIGLP